MKATGPNARLSAVTEDIIAIKVRPTDTVAGLERKLHRVLRKHGIRKGQEIEGGSAIQNTFEWTGARAIFDDHVRAERLLERCFAEVPKDLRAYPYRPRRKRAS